jgi:hypothetical protein
VHLESLRGDKFDRVYHCNNEKVWVDSGEEPAKEDAG